MTERLSPADVNFFSAGARMTERFPILPLNEGQALSIALTSYDRGAFFGVNADSDAVPAVNQVCAALSASLAELVDLSRPETRATILATPGFSSRFREETHQ